jgi:hypothetical protein
LQKPSANATPSLLGSCPRYPSNEWSFAPEAIAPILNLSRLSAEITVVRSLVYVVNISSSTTQNGLTIILVMGTSQTLQPCDGKPTQMLAATYNRSPGSAAKGGGYSRTLASVCLMPNIAVGCGCSSVASLSSVITQTNLGPQLGFYSWLYLQQQLHFISQWSL